MIKYDQDGYPEGHPDKPGSNQHPGESAPKVREKTPSVAGARPVSRKDRAYPNSDPSHEKNWSYHHERPDGADDQAMAGAFVPDDYHLDHGGNFRDLEKELGEFEKREGHHRIGKGPEPHPHPDEAKPVRGDDMVGQHSPADFHDIGKLGPAHDKAYHNHLTNREHAGPERFPAYHSGGADMPKGRK